MQHVREHPKANPLVIAAAVAVLMFCVLGTAAITGHLPRAISQTPWDHAATPATPACSTCGFVESVRAVEIQGEASGLGAVAGGVAGGVLGHQVGRGSGNTLATIAGAAGGAYAGHTLEKNAKKHTAYRVVIRLEDGTSRTLTQDVPPPFAVGERVRIVNGSTLERA